MALRASSGGRRMFGACRGRALMRQSRGPNVLLKPCRSSWNTSAAAQSAHLRRSKKHSVAVANTHTQHRQEQGHTRRCSKLSVSHTPRHASRHWQRTREAGWRYGLARGGRRMRTSVDAPESWAERALETLSLFLEHISSSRTVSTPSPKQKTQRRRSKHTHTHRTRTTTDTQTSP